MAEAHRRHATPMIFDLFGTADAGDEPVDEEKTIPPGHGSKEYNITEINGVVIAKFSFVTIAARGLTTTGGSGNKIYGVRLSDDGGTTFIDGASDYRSIWFDDTVSSFSDQGYMKIENDAGGNWSCLIKNMNALMPTSLLGHELSTGNADPKRWAGMTLSSVVVHDAIQVLVAQGGTPVFTGGILDLVGYR